MEGQEEPEHGFLDSHSPTLCLPGRGPCCSTTPWQCWGHPHGPGQGSCLTHEMLILGRFFIGAYSGATGTVALRRALLSFTSLALGVVAGVGGGGAVGSCPEKISSSLCSRAASGLQYPCTSGRSPLLTPAGALGTLNQLAIVTGILIAQVTGPGLLGGWAGVGALGTG